MGHGMTKVKDDNEKKNMKEDPKEEEGKGGTESSVEEKSSALALVDEVERAEKTIGRQSHEGDTDELSRGIPEPRENISVEDTYIPGKPFFTPEVVKDFLANPPYLDNFDTYLTMQLLVSVSDVLERERNLVEVGNGTTMFVGDIHGDYRALTWILDRFRSLGPKIEHLVFLGDYVDAGKDSLKVVNRLYLEKLADPGRIILLRGNNETLPINYHYGFLDEIKETFLEQHHGKVFNWYNEIFALLPLALLHGGGTLALHGGIPRLLDNIRELDSLEANTELSGNDVLFEMLWNDPIDENVGFEPSPRGERARLFGRKIFDIFLRDNGLKRMIVAHKALEDGFEYFFDRRLLRIFSAPNYRGKNNAGAIAILNRDGEFTTERISLENDDMAARDD